jgi:hypothetical protein
VHKKGSQLASFFIEFVLVYCHNILTKEFVMIEATLADLRQPAVFAQWSHDVVHLVDARKKQDVGFFVPYTLAHEFQPLFDALAKKQKQALLQRVAQAQLADPIEEDALADGFE